MRKTKFYNTNEDLANDNVYTKFGFNISIRSRDMEQKPNSDVNQGRNSVANLHSVYTKFGLNQSIRFHDIEQKLNSDVNQGHQLLIQAFIHVLVTCKMKKRRSN